MFSLSFSIKNTVFISIFFVIFFFQCDKEMSETPAEQTGVIQTPTGTASPSNSDSENSAQATNTAEVTETNQNTSSNVSTTVSMGGDAFPIEAPVILAYFPSWSENWVSSGQDSKLRTVPSFVNHLF